MKIFTRVLPAALLLTLTTPAFANYFEYLEKQFKAANENVDLSNYLEFGHPLSPICVEFVKERPLDEMVVAFGLYTRSSDGAGPGLPPVSITKLLFATSTYQDLGYMFDTAVTDTKNKKEIKVTQELPEKFTLLIRRSKNYSYFKRTRQWSEHQQDPKDENKTIEVPKTEDRYGYCFPDPKNVKEGSPESQLGPDELPLELPPEESEQPAVEAPAEIPPAN